MVKRKNSYEVKIIENMRSGEGAVKIEHLLSLEELNSKGRLYAKVTLEPDTSIGSHVHEGEMESFFIISGQAQYNDNGETVTLYPGDTTHTPSGKGHSVKNARNETLELIALILFS